MLSNFAKRIVGIRIDPIIITPPIVGVPSFSFCPSRPKSLTVSPTCFLCKYAISLLPKTIEIISEQIIAIAALNVIN